MNPNRKNQKQNNDYQRRDDVTVDELRNHGRFSAYNDQQLQAIIETVKDYCRMVLWACKDPSLFEHATQ